MKLNTMLLTSAATLMVTSAAFAADLPSKKAAPSSGSVQICKVAGKTGFTLPGSDTCVVIGGFVRAQLDLIGTGTGELGGYRVDTSDWEKDTYSGSVTASIKIGAYTNTDMGVLASYVDARPASGSVDSAYLQLGGLKAGYYASTFGLMDGGPSMGWAAIAPSFKPAAQIGYSAALGNGVTLGVALEQNNPTACYDHSYCIFDYGYSETYSQNSNNRQMPDVVGTLDFAVAGAEIHLGGVYHSNNDYDSAGYAVDAAAKFKLDSIAKGDSVTVEYSYANGAADRLVNPFINVAANGYDAIYQWPDSAHGTGGTEGYSVGVQFDHNFSSNLSGTLYYGYTHASLDASGYWDRTMDFNSNRFGAVLDWQPVKNFHVKPEVYHVTLDGTSEYQSSSADYTGGYTTGMLRIQRDF